jgi:hypothetical protein
MEKSTILYRDLSLKSLLKTMSFLNIPQLLVKKKVIACIVKVNLFHR